MAKVKLISDKYTSFGGSLSYGAPFSFTLENGAAVIEEEIARHIKAVFPDVEIVPLEEPTIEAVVTEQSASDGEKPASENAPTGGGKAERPTPRKAVK
ncbi:MAG: hypothetical protein ACPL5F_01385 [Moorellaceae bacterium]